MTKTEFENLKFGDKIYNSYEYTMLWTGNTTTTNSKVEYYLYVENSGILHFDQNIIMSFSITKPKKKVMKIESGYMDFRDLNRLLVGQLYPEIPDDCVDEENLVPVTISYEIEED